MHQHSNTEVWERLFLQLLFPVWPCGVAGILIYRLLPESQQYQVKVRELPLACLMCLRVTIWCFPCPGTATWWHRHLWCPSATTSQYRYTSLCACLLSILPCDRACLHICHALDLLVAVLKSTLVSLPCPSTRHICLHAYHVPVLPCGGQAYLFKHLTCSSILVW